MSALPTWAYALACILAPAAWGAFTAWLFLRRDRRAGTDAADDRDRAPPVDYMI
jgi:hypothetical protein